MDHDDDGWCKAFDVEVKSVQSPAGGTYMMAIIALISVVIVLILAKRFRRKT